MKKIKITLPLDQETLTYFKTLSQELDRDQESLINEALKFIKERKLRPVNTWEEDNFKKSAKSLGSLYHIIKDLSGPIEAKKFLSTAVYGAISELQENGTIITDQAIESKLEETAADFKYAAKKNK